jgi:hypothetical protein
MSRIPTYSNPTEGSQTALRYRSVVSQCRSYLGSASRENPIFIARCRRCAIDQQSI